MPEPAANAPDTEADFPSILRRLKTIEHNSPSQGERAVTRLGARAGLFATLISILTGSFAVYSEVFVKPNEGREKAFQQFVTYVQQLASAGPRLAVVARTTPDPIERQTLAAAINTERFVALDGAEQLLPQILGKVSAPQLIMLAQAEADIGNPKTARDHLSHAIERAEGVMRAEALRQRGRMLSTTGDPASQAAAMADFAAGFAALAPIGQWGTSVMRSSILHDWIIGENQFGSCVKATELVPQFLEHVGKPDVGGDARTAYKTDLRQTLLVAHRCTFNLSLLD